jgi:TPP-dependent indolepyruvate ferredoxin oxidoreductase alpha subunit
MIRVTGDFMRLLMVAASLITTALLGVAVIVSFGQPTPPSEDPCKAVNDQLAQYAVAVARLQVALQQSQNETLAAKAISSAPKAPVTSEKK